MTNAIKFDPLTRAIDVRVDFISGYGHVRFRRPGEGEHYGSSFVRDPNGDDLDVVLEQTDNGEVIGIEVLSLAKVTLDAAEAIARQHGLAFPTEIFEAARKARAMNPIG